MQQRRQVRSVEWTDDVAVSCPVHFGGFLGVGSQASRSKAAWGHGVGIPG